MAWRNIYMPDSLPEGKDPGNWLPAGYRGQPHMVKVEQFPDGEFSIEVPALNQDDDIYLVGECSTALASETFLAGAYEIAALGPRKLTVMNTYFRHARSERETDGHAALAKFQARQWSGLGRVFPGVRLFFVDLHKDLILNYFEGPVHVHQMEFRSVLAERIRKDAHARIFNPVYATVDEGGVHVARQMATYDKAGFAHIEKHRISGSETKVVKVLGDSVEGKDVVIFDDMIATGGSVIQAAQAYRERGARDVTVAATHGVFVGDAVAKIDASGVIDRVYVTDSHPNSKKFKDHYLIHVIPLFGLAYF